MQVTDVRGFTAPRQVIGVAHSAGTDDKDDVGDGESLAKSELCVVGCLRARRGV